ncbi:MAG: serine hydrolase domain-containing protein [Alphaproteobacteria bacterium]
MQDTLDIILRAAVERGDIAHGAAIITDADAVLYQGQFGPRQLGETAPLAEDTIYWIHSMTKPLVAAAVMQLVEAGRIGLDDDCGELLPSLKAPQVLEGFDANEQPILRPAKGAITLRHLLTHTAGFVYDMWNADQYRWLKQSDLKRGDCYGAPTQCPPLARDPGTAWEYGINIDWAGKVLEALTGGTLDAYLQDHLFKPLGMASTGFVVTESIRDRLSGVHQRDESGSIGAVPFDPPLNLDPALLTGGGGLYGSAQDYARFMRMMLNQGTLDGVRVLQQETVAAMSANQIGNIQVTGLPTSMPNMTFPFDFYPGVEKRWGLSYMINMADIPGARRAGSLSWAGLRNSYFWIDPTSGIAAAIFTQMLPFADPKTLAVYDAFERGVYAASGRA